jgi:Zn-dependent protease with chaperone function
MGATIENMRPALTSQAPGTRPPAATAAARAWRVGIAFGALGLGASLVVIVPLLQSWRVAPSRSGHAFSVIGLRLGYPVANVDAVIVLMLACLGLAVVGTALTVAGREVYMAARFDRRLAELEIRRIAGARVFADERVRAFCAGLFRPQVFISSGAVKRLDPVALEAVLRHERHHVRRRDPLRTACVRVLAKALFFVPGVARVARDTLTLTELSADESVIVVSAGGRSALARAMLGFSGADAEPGMGVDPARVDHMLGEPPEWRLPIGLCLAGSLVLMLLVAVAALAGQAAAGSTSLALPGVSRQPCVLVLALIPAVVGWFVTVLRLRVR